MSGFWSLMGLDQTRFRYLRLAGDDNGVVWWEGAPGPDGPYTRIEDEDAVRKLIRDVTTSPRRTDSPASDGH